MFDRDEGWIVYGLIALAVAALWVLAQCAA